MEWDLLCYCISSSSDILKNLCTSKQPGPTIPTHGLGTRGPSPASPEQGVQHLEHKPLSAGILVFLCRAPCCKLCEWTPLSLLGSHSAFNGEEEVLEAGREEKAALHFCEGGEGYITFLCYPSLFKPVLHQLPRILLAARG